MPLLERPPAMPTPGFQAPARTTADLPQAAFAGLNQFAQAKPRSAER